MHACMHSSGGLVSAINFVPHTCLVDWSGMPRSLTYTALPTVTAWSRRPVACGVSPHLPEQRACGLCAASMRQAQKGRTFDIPDSESQRFGCMAAGVARMRGAAGRCDGGGGRVCHARRQPRRWRCRRARSAGRHSGHGASPMNNYVALAIGPNMGHTCRMACKTVC